MIKHYSISQEGIKKSDSSGNWLILHGATKEEQDQIVKEYDLPEDIFLGATEAEEVARFEPLYETKLKNVFLLIVLNLEKYEDKIENRLEPVLFIISDELIITNLAERSTFIERFIKRFGEKVRNFDELVAYSIFKVYTHYTKELQEIKVVIDELDESARKTTKTQELVRLADTQRAVVYLDHTLKGQKKVLGTLWDRDSFTDELNDPHLVFNIQQRQEQAEKLINLYRDLLETVGGLFNDMMNNNLNQLLKYLDSAALVISIPALISGIWGMNTGGLPGKEQGTGFLWVIGLSVVATAITIIHLKRKDYTK